MVRESATAAAVRPPIVHREAFWAEHAALFDALVGSVEWDARFRARKTASFGSPYNYSGIEYPACAMHPALVEVAEAVAPYLGGVPNNALLNLYPDGASRMGFHFDATDRLAAGTGIAIVSLGSARSLAFRRKGDRAVVHRFRLVPGSLLVMGAEMQAEWRHGVPAEPGAGARISVTFRCLIG